MSVQHQDSAELGTTRNGHLNGCPYDYAYPDGHTIRYVPTVRKGRGRGLSVPKCLCHAEVCTDDECPDHGHRVFNMIIGWHDEPPKGATRWR